MLTGQLHCECEVLKGMLEREVLRQLCHSVRGLLHYKYCPPDTSLHLSYNSPHTTLVILLLGDDLQFQDYDTLPFIYIIIKDPDLTLICCCSVNDCPF